MYLGTKVARFFLVQTYQMTANYTKLLYIMPNGHKIFQMIIKYNKHFPFQCPPKTTPTGIFGLKTNHLATLVGTWLCRCCGLKISPFARTQGSQTIAWSYNQLLYFLPCRRGIVVIASAYRTEDPGFESRQGVRFLGL
jgi:hypothetical protein